MNHAPMEKQLLQGKVLVVGLGKTGLSCARFLRDHGYEVAVTDSHAKPPGLKEIQSEMPDLPLFLGGFDDNAVKAAGTLVVSPGIPLDEPAIAKALNQGKQIIGDIEVFALYADAPIAAITGSNGKSTVTTLLGEMAREAGIKVQIGGNLGEPALDLLGLGADLYVLELSSFQLDTTHSLKPKVSVVLNLSADHMDRYADFNAYGASKATIYREADARIFNADDAKVMAMAERRDQDRMFTLDEPDEGQYGLREYSDGRWLCLGSRQLIPVSELLIPGSHNIANALAAWALADILEIPDLSKRQVLRRYRGLEHRTELVGEYNGVRWYNDSKGTNVGATVAALDGLTGPESVGKIVLIAGGDCKDADFTDLASAAARAARAVVLIGRDAPMIEEVLKGQVELVKARDMRDAVRLANELAKEGDSVLLSPACASFDMFNNYMHRGDVFRAAVKELMS